MYGNKFERQGRWPQKALRLESEPKGSLKTKRREMRRREQITGSKAERTDPCDITMISM
jgi:hypothetical protein